MKVLVTGSAGLIGQWVCKALQTDNHEVIGLDWQHNQQYTDRFYECDILDKEQIAQCFRDENPQSVIHLAARIDLEETRQLNGYAANIDGVHNILECVRDTDSVERVIVTSSQLVCRVGYVPKTDDEYCPNTLYGKSKVLTEQITRELDGGGKPWCLVRPTTVWGPGMSPHYETMLRLIRAGRYFHCGRGKLFKSYSYAGNIAHQYRQMLTAPDAAIHQKTFYLADYEPFSLREYTNGLARELNAPKIPTMPLPLAKILAWTGDLFNAVGMKRFPFNSFRLRNILTEYRFDMTSTRNVCGDLPYSFDDGICETASWFLSTQDDK